MQCNRQLDPVEQSNVKQCMNTFYVQMETRWFKIKQCIAQILTDLAHILLSVDIVYPLPPFPLDLLESKRQQVGRQFETNMNKWIDNALMKKRKKSCNCITISEPRLTTQARQQYGEESDFFAQCFVTMNAYIQECVRMCKQIQSNTTRTVDLLHDIGLCMMIRFALIVLKRKHQWNNESGNFPIFRYKATVICHALHVELDARHPKKLSIVQWIQNRREFAKPKRAIGAKEFCGYLRDYLQCLYHEIYHSIARKMILKIPNIIEFDDQHITVCGLMANNSVCVEEKRNEILRYFDATPPESHSERVTQGTEVEKKADEQVLFPDVWTPPMMYFNTNNSPFIPHCDTTQSPPRMHDYCEAQLAELRHDKEALQAQVQTLQQDKQALEAQVHKMQQRLNEYAYRERIRRFQYVQWQTRENRAYAVNSHIQSLRRDANGNHHYDHNPRHNHTPQ